jgi:hypothetical protein
MSIRPACDPSLERSPFEVTNKGLSLKLPVRHIDQHCLVALLDLLDRQNERIGLESIGDGQHQQAPRPKLVVMVPGQGEWESPGPFVLYLVVQDDHDSSRNRMVR